jgi:hypothetical protein
MDWQTILTSVFIFLSAAMVLGSYLRFRPLSKAMAFVPEMSRPGMLRFFRHQKLLMLFFIFGFIMVGIAFILNLHFTGELFVAAIFLLSAVFIFSGVNLQAAMIEEIQGTIEELLPICANCKRIRDVSSDPYNSKSWIEIETYISGQTRKKMTHGMCPECLQKYYPEYVRMREKGRMAANAS